MTFQVNAWHDRFSTWLTCLSIFLLLLLSFSLTAPQTGQAALLSPDEFDVSGRLTEQVSVNTQNLGDNAAAHPLNPATFTDQRGELSMVRSEAWIEMEARPSNWLTLDGTFRGVQELPTDVMKDFNRASDANVGKNYYDRAEVRELYATIEMTPDVSLELGKQQFVMGKSDFFQALDMVHGRDLSWRLFLEPNEQWRKTNWMAKTSINLDQWGGITVQPFWIPGIDRQSGLLRSSRSIRDLAVGKTADFVGGRWQLAGGEGLCVTCGGPAFAPGPTGNLNLPINASHPAADVRDSSYGLRTFGRWRGFGDVMSTVGLDGFSGAEWSMAYMHVPLNGPFDDNFVINSSMPDGSNPVYPVDPHGAYKGSITNPGTAFDLANAVDGGMDGDARGELLYPYMDVVGLSGNTYYAPLGTVFRTEIALNIDKPYNMGPESAGFNGIAEVDMFNVMFGMDWGSLDWTQTWLGTDRPSTLNLQVFDEWIPSADNRTGNERLVDIAGGAASPHNHQQEHQVMATAQFFTHYANDGINPTLFAGADLSNGGGFVAPSVSFAPSTNWLYKIEGNFFWEEGDNCAPPGCHLFDALDDKNQVLFEATYQF